MAWYPNAIRMEIPESGSQTTIIPDQMIFHSIAAPWSLERLREHWQSTNLESHFGLEYSGRLGQYMTTTRRADATSAANRRPNGHGAISIETSSNTKATDPWTDAQIDALVALGVWGHETHGIPLRVCRSWDDPGFGFHRLFREWNPDVHACPGDLRAQQFYDVIMPRIKNGDITVPIYGTDVSGYQPINFALDLPGASTRKVDFAIIKVTEGISYVNPRWTGQRQWARDHGLSVGFYHFGRPSSAITAQADFFLGQIALQPGDHLWFDWEDAGISNSQKDQWIKYVQSQRPGHKVGLYCNTNFWINRDTTSFAGDGLWIADYGSAAGSPPVQAPWLIHQFSDSGGYDHDLARFGSRAEMIAWARGEGDDVALTTEDKTWLKNEIRAAIKELVYAQVWEQDRMTPPAGQATEGNKTWMAQSLLRYADERADVLLKETAGVRSALGAILSQAQTNGSNGTAANMKLDAIMAVLESVDLDALPAEIASKLSGLKFVLTEGE